MSRKRAAYRFLKLTGFAVLFLVGLEAVSLAICIGILKISFNRWSQNAIPPSVPFITKTVGFLYQDQRAKQGFYPDPLLSYRLVPGSQFGSYSDLDVPEVTASRILVGSAGFVKNNSNPADGEPLKQGERVLFVTGGSPVAGEDMLANEDTVPSQLEVWIRNKCGPGSTPVRVINAGVPGFTATQELSYFLYDLAFLRPVAWIQLTGINEAWHQGKMHGSTELFYNKHARGLPYLDSMVRFNFLPATQKAFLVWLPILLGRPTWRPDLWPVERKEADQRTAYRFMTLIREGEAAARRLGIHYYYFLQPTSSIENRAPTPTEKRLREYSYRPQFWDTYVRSAKTFFEEVRKNMSLDPERSPNWHDLTSVFEPVVGKDVYSTPRHYTRYGAGLIAEEIGKILLADRMPEICGVTATRKAKP